MGRQALKLSALAVVAVGLLLMAFGVWIYNDAMTVPGHGFGVLMAPWAVIGPLISLVGIAAFRGRRWPRVIGAVVLFGAGLMVLLWTVISPTLISVLVFGGLGLADLWAAFVLYRGWRLRL